MEARCPRFSSGATPFISRLPGWAAGLLAPSQLQGAAAATPAAIAIEKTIQVTVPPATSLERAIQAEAAREVATLLGRVLRRAQAGRRPKSGSRGDGLLCCPAPGRHSGSQSIVAVCQACAGSTRYPLPMRQWRTTGQLRSRRILTVVGELELTRPWYLCPRGHHRQFSRGSPTGHEDLRLLPRSTPHGCDCGPARAFGSRPRAEEDSGRTKSGRPIGGAHPGRRWNRHRPASTFPAPCRSSISILLPAPMGIGP